MENDAATFDEKSCWAHIRAVLQRSRERRLGVNATARAVRRIELVLDEHVQGEPNSRAIAALKRIANDIPASHRAARDTAFEIHARATLFYSEDHKYLVHGGAARLYEEMRITLLDRLRNMARSP